MKSLTKYAITALIILAIWLGGYVYFAWSALSFIPKEVETKTEAIIVLTGGQGRIETGLELLMGKSSPILFITGVHPHVKRHEIKKLWPGSTPLPDDRIILGYDARTTQQNAEETKAWLEAQKLNSIRLVTGNFHLRRAMLEFKHVLPDATIIPHPIIQPKFESTQKRYWIMSFGEYNKTLFRVLMMNFEGILPDEIVNLQLNPDEKPEAILQ